MKLISFNAPDGLHLKGFLTQGQSNLATIIHIHGNSGNFYENDFIRTMAEMYQVAGINFLCVNNRGHDVIAEAYRNGKLVYIGGAYGEPEECILDIEGAVTFAQKLGAPIILQGHSFGCLTTLAYLLKNGRPLDCILLSPADAYQLQANYIQPETVPDQIRRIKCDYAHHLNILLPAKEFGIRQDGVEYHIPISAGTFIALFSGWLPKILRYDDNALNYYLKTNGFVYVGGKDALQTQTKTFVEDFFLNRMQNLHFSYFEDGDHHFHGLENLVVSDIIEWVSQKVTQSLSL